MFDDLTRVCDSLNILWKVKGKNTNNGFVNLCCFYCEEDRFHLSVNREEGWFSCWRCGEKGRWWKLLSGLAKEYPSNLWQSIPRPDSGAIWLPTIDEDATRKEKETPEYRNLDENKDSRYFDWLCAMPSNDEMGLEDRPRGFSYDAVRDSGVKLGQGVLNGYFVWELNVGLMARKFSSEVPGPKWRAVDTTSNSIFGYHNAKRVSPATGFITEGIFDALRFPSGEAISILGLTTSDVKLARVALAFENSKRIVLAFDRGVKRDVWLAWAMGLTDFGYDVSAVNWDTIDEECKDVDEVRIHYGEERFRRFVELVNYDSFL